ncbi:DUF4365 and DUF1817 domain-containing protein [Vibrio cholerae]|uniref:DUF4365 and DUF1817 domain-containing protein n=1 Tax=Vibrio cholerae TaxID=666 RepID=UPI002934AC4F|nr:DUF4365 and DUF1817 domain-containing protein [Vibrio cholerae]MDV2319334.1 DUF4365 and DUF1817 domain-containing protein [Vibrio cholerae]
MNSFDFPNYSRQQMTGNIGEIFLERFVVQELGFIYRRVPQESDFGIDGYIDIVDCGQVTGRSIAVQIKCGDSYISKKKDGGIRYFGENKHLNYLMNLSCPVILVVLNSECTSGYWQEFSPSSTNPTKNGWWLEFTSTNTLSVNIKQRWMQIAGEANDFSEALQLSWKTNEALDMARVNSYVIHKDDIESLDFSGVYNLIERLTRTKESLLNNRNKLNLYVLGYDSDPRELYEISEVRRWFKISLENGVPWFYFLSNDNDYMSIKIYLYSCCNISVSMKSLSEKETRFRSFEDIEYWLDMNFKNLNNFVDKNNIPDYINESISKNISTFMIALANG